MKEWIKKHWICSIAVAFTAGVLVSMVIHIASSQIPTQDEVLGRDAQGDLNLLGNLRFPSTTTAGLHMGALTSAERDALVLGVTDFCIIFNTDQGRMNFWDGTQWDSNAPSASTSWGFSTNTSEADPGAGRMRYDSATPNLVTEIYVSDINSEGTDISVVLETLSSGDNFLAIQADNSSNNLSGTLGVPVDNTGWWSIPLTAVVGNGVVPTNNKIVNTEFTQATVAAQLESITISGKEIRDAIYGMFPSSLMYVHDGNAAEPTTDATPRLIQGWASNGITHPDLVPDHTDDTIRSTVAGVFACHVSLSVKGSSGKRFHFEIYMFDDSASAWVATGFAATDGEGDDTDRSSLSFFGKLDLDENDKVGVFHHSPDGGSTMTLMQGQLMINRVNQ